MTFRRPHRRVPHLSPAEEARPDAVSQLRESGCLRGQAQQAYSFAHLDSSRQTVRAVSSDSLFRQIGYGKISLLVSVALAKKGERLTRDEIQLFAPDNFRAIAFRLQRPWNDQLVYLQISVARPAPVGTGVLASIACRNLEGSLVNRFAGESSP